MRRIRNTYISHAITINGERVNIDYARIVYKCAECLGDLKRHNAGLVCKTDPNHRRFIHRNEGAKIKAMQAEQLKQVAAIYEIVDGQITTKES